MNVPAFDRRSTTSLVVVLRLDVTPTGDLRFGTLVDLDERLRGRLSGWEDLVPAVARFVAEELPAAPGQRPGGPSSHD